MTAARQIGSHLKRLSPLPVDESPLGPYKQLVTVYNRIIADEVRDHALYAINSIYDLQRGDSLKKKMRLVKREFGDILLQHE